MIEKRYLGDMAHLFSRISNYLTAMPEIKLAPYQSYATRSHLYLLGRAVDDDKLQMYEKQSLWRTLVNTYKQFDSHEIPDAQIRLELPTGASLSSRTNSEGYFLFDRQLSFDLGNYTDPEGWVDLELCFAEPVDRTLITQENRFIASVLIPPESVRFGVISDVDDTILHTGVTSFLKYKVIQNSLFRHAHDRLSLEGAPELYRMLHRGASGAEQNPIFYLSNSPWNLYEYLKLFLEINDFPRGPILLRDFRTPLDRTLKPEKPHKQKEIINILKTYPQLKFVLIGDSGEHDPAIYTEIAMQFPHRIIAIYLRSVQHSRRMEHVQSIIDQFHQVPVLSVDHSQEAVAHAKELGLLSEVSADQ